MTREKIQETADFPDSCINDGMDVNPWEPAGHTFPKFGGEFETQLRGILGLRERQWVESAFPGMKFSC